MLRSFLFALAMALACASGPIMAAPGFAYDHQLALDLGRSYARPLAQIAGKSGVALDLDRPKVIARTFQGNRHFVQVSYGAGREGVGAAVTLEQCQDGGPLVWVDWSYWSGGEHPPTEKFENANGDADYVAPNRCPIKPSES
jgi:hypothetical protein